MVFGLRWCHCHQKKESHLHQNSRNSYILAEQIIAYSYKNSFDEGHDYDGKIGPLFDAILSDTVVSINDEDPWLPIGIGGDCIHWLWV